MEGKKGDLGDEEDLGDIGGDGVRRRRTGAHFPGALLDNPIFPSGPLLAGRFSPMVRLIPSTSECGD